MESNTLTGRLRPASDIVPTPSKKTVMFCLVLSMLMRTVDATGFVVFDAA
jgi:hypothetical protein